MWYITGIGLENVVESPWISPKLNCGHPAFTVTASVCVFCVSFYMLYYWWGGPGGIEAWSLGPLLPSAFWHCSLGHLTHKNPSPIWSIMCLVGRSTLLNQSINYKCIIRIWAFNVWLSCSWLLCQAMYCDQCVCVSILRISKSKLHKICRAFNHGRGLVLLWRQCSTLCTARSVDAHNWCDRGNAMRACAQSDSPAQNRAAKSDVHGCLNNNNNNTDNF